jgi:hypothetical protein
LASLAFERSTSKAYAAANNPLLEISSVKLEFLILFETSACASALSYFSVSAA